MKYGQMKVHADYEARHWWFGGRMNIIKDLLNNIVPPFKDHIVIDIGCGTGGVIANLSKEYQVIGIDPSKDGTDFAKALQPDLEIIHGYFAQHFRQYKVDAKAYLMLDVLEHVENDNKLLSEAISIMSPGSYLIITVPANLSMWSPHDVSYGHFRRYTKTTFELLWKDLPVEPLMVSYFNARLYPLIKLIRGFTQRRSKAFGKAGTDVKIPLFGLNRILKWIFRGESKILLDHYYGKRDIGYIKGVSLIAMLRLNR